METEIQFIVECPICSERYSAGEGSKPRRTSCCDNVLCECCINRLCHDGVFRCPHCQMRKPIGSALSLKVSRETLHFLDALCSLCAECPGSKCNHCHLKLCRFCVAAHKLDVEADIARLADAADKLDERRAELGRCLARLVSAAEQAAARGSGRLVRAADDLRAESARARETLDQAERASEMPRISVQQMGTAARGDSGVGKAELAAIRGCHQQMLRLLARAEAKAVANFGFPMNFSEEGESEDDDGDEEEEGNGEDAWESLSGPELAAGTAAAEEAPAVSACSQPVSNGAQITQLLGIPLDSPVWCVLCRQQEADTSQLLLVESRRVRFLNWNPARPHVATAERSWSTDRVVIRAAVALTPSRELLLTAWGRDGVMRVDSSGALIAQTGGPGSELGQFRRPYGLAYDGRRRVYVCDTGNNRLQVLLYPMLHAVGLVGADGSLSEPKSAALDGDRLLVTHSGGLAVFSAKTSSLVATYTEGLASTVPRYGSFLAVHPVSKQVFVSCKSTIQAFSLAGYQLQRQFEISLPGRKVRWLAAHATETVLFAETKCTESKSRRLLCLRVEPLETKPVLQQQQQQLLTSEPGASHAWTTIKNAVLKAIKD